MKPIKNKILFILIGAAIFDALFFKQRLGLNILIFTILAFVAMILSKTVNLKSRKTLITMGGTLLAAVLLVINNSVMTGFAYFISLAIFLGFAFDDEIKTAYTAFIAAFIRIFTTQAESFKNISTSKTGKSFVFFKFFKLIILPVIILLIFHFIFTAANPEYKHFISDIFEAIGDFFQQIFKDIDANVIWIFILGWFTTNIFIFKGMRDKFKNKNLQKSDNIIRKRSIRRKRFSKMGLKNENRIAFLTIVMVNILLIINNIIDINWIWAGNVSTNPITLSQLVHQGTFYLILSIFLSMGIMLYFFRKNQNFYPKKKALKIVSYIWILQNIFLAFSVAYRNYYYITNAGLAYKRIGVIFFLILTIVGLVLMFQKINKKKSMFYLLRTNSWSVFAVLLLMACFNWDVLIANYNIDHTNQGLDRKFLFNLSNKALYVIDENRGIVVNDSIDDQINRRHGYGLYDVNERQKILDEKIKNFIENYEQRSWLSWNYADHISYKKLIEMY